MASSATLPGQRFCSFEQALPAANIAATLTTDHWELMPYNTIYGNGTMLLCRGNALPKPVTIRPGQRGWQKIYVCLLSGSYPSAGLALKLKGDSGSSFFCKNAVNPKYYRWSAAEMAEEYFWECADMTDEEITIEKLHDTVSQVLALLWIRFEPMTEAEVAAYRSDHAKPGLKPLHAHTDLDWIQHIDKITPDMFAPFIHTMEHSDAELLSVEFYQLMIDFSFIDELAPDAREPLMSRRAVMAREFVKHKDEVYPYLTRECHKRGMRVYAALRHCIGVSPLPFDYSYVSHVAYAVQHPEYFCKDRDGETINVISFAYQDPQDYIIGEYLKMLDYGFDGITMFFHRGIWTLFEEPVLKLCAEMYDGLDARKLAMDDERLMAVHGELITRFIRRTREALDQYSAEHGRGHLGITIVGNYSIKDNRVQGIDIQRWAEEKLIDNVVVGNMRITENDAPFLDETGLLDMEKFKDAKYHQLNGPVSRHYWGGIDQILPGVDEFMAISRRTGLQVYFEVPWECTVAPEYYHEYALKLYQAGAEHLSLWDCFHTRVMNRAEWNAVYRLGHADELAAMSPDREAYGRSVRVLSLNNISVAGFHPAWRG